MLPRLRGRRHWSSNILAVGAAHLLGSAGVPESSLSRRAERGHAMPASIKVAVITHAGGAHLGSYLPALAATAEADAVVLAGMAGLW